MVTVTSLGHGTLDADSFGALASGSGIDLIVDVRRFPGSRRHPHFAAEELAAWLPGHGIGYRWLPSLGGRRRPDPDSPNVALRNLQFRAYADHMASAEFADGVAELLGVASGHDVAVLCSESVWWRCHRRLLADHLVVVGGTQVAHLFHDGRLSEHPPLAAARQQRDHLVYDRT